MSVCDVGLAIAAFAAVSAKADAVDPTVIIRKVNYVADRLGEALTAKLFQVNDVRITPSTAAQELNEQKTPLPQIAKELGVNMIVLESCRDARQGP